MSSYFYRNLVNTKKPTNPQPGLFAPLPQPFNEPRPPITTTPQWRAPYPGPWAEGGVPPPPMASRNPVGGLPFDPPASTSTAKKLTKLVWTLAPNDYVEVNLRARGWVIGIVICVCELANAVCNWGYRVRFSSAEGRSEERVFPPGDVRRASPGNGQPCT